MESREAGQRAEARDSQLKDVDNEIDVLKGLMKGSDKVHVVLELHPEQGYDKFQQDPEEWTGPKDKYR